MAVTAEKSSPATPAAWTLRDEMAMRLAAALVIRGGWVDGQGSPINDMPRISGASYQFADYMLAARGREV